MANALASDYRLSEGDIVFIDGGAVYDGYATDFIRQACLGEPRDDQTHPRDHPDMLRPGASQMRHTPTDVVDRRRRLSAHLPPVHSIGPTFQSYGR